MTAADHVDVLIIGAGISGIGAAHYLRSEQPSKTFTIVEARGAAGGTWDLFRYPGIRSDSDLHTFGYEFKPWTDKQAIADAPRILDYLHETIEDNRLAGHIRYHHKVVSAAWSSDDARWLVDIERADTGERTQISARWIFCGSGYYDYDEGFSPDFAGQDRFRGQIVHPQHWPEDLDYTGKRVVVIGSGATAVTLLPAMADETAHVTMLQRTPTYVIPLPREDALANALKRIFGDKRGYALTRQKNVAQQRILFELCQRFPRVARRMIRKINESQLPDDFPVDVHFNPPYDPWDQRLCVVPDADLFRTIRAGKASIVTDRIASFTETGILLESGTELEADIIVTATGLNIKIIGGIELTVDGEPVSLPDTVVYRGIMLSGVPNFALAIGYTNASWTLKIGLLCQYFCKLLGYMDSHGHDAVWAVADPDMPTRPLLDFGAGYVQRALDTLPKQGPRAPWVMSMSYYTDRRLFKGGVADENLRFARARQPEVLA
ncbi:flavin-containing monooxygenase [Gordonia amicalis]|uniref:flavin-containing monooxygenase n=1 Tax=Gordonia amicalis TaxID=89053 RepID=UPI0002A645C7|nr:NAD(P)/FAD-dependent oxidoreductase [Gordonia amicalis]MDV7175717.1 NAD(P)/FAD-dependent oxidoreductase [Gordonia amicalis]NKX77553.1 NAD(P)/FAD-dependent oxidoreductase [Gordonia amicalis]GAC52591.1 putative monooxygenase [Gordonia amicalis NBRC 100051 = JCM 11271]